MNCCCSAAKSCLTLCGHMDCRTPGFPIFHISQSLLKFMSIELVKPSNHLVLYCPLLLLPSIFPGIRVFSYELALHIRQPKYWNFSFSISPPNSRVISFRIDGLDFLAVQGAPSQKSSPAPQFESINSLWFFLKPFSLLYGPTLTSVHNYWKNNSFDYMDICW